jgi:hypothetical protein
MLVDRGVAVDHTQDFPEAFGRDADRHQQRHVPDLAGPAAPEHDPVEADVGVGALDRAIPLRLGLPVDPS